MSRPTPLTDLHREAGARLVDFAGWEMPLQYGGIQEEHRAVRAAVGLFDVSHMGRVSVHGPGALGFLDGLLPCAVSRLIPGQLAYTVLCNDAGGAIDDLEVYCIADDHYLLVVNAARREVDLAWMRAHVPVGAAVALVDDTLAQGMVAIQGPQAEAVLGELFGRAATDLAFFRCAVIDRGAEGEWLVSRSGYTGEDGFEAIGPAASAPAVWQAAVAAGGRPAGLAARDTLRLEAGLCLYGHELTEETTPLEAGLTWTLALDKAEPFPGCVALRRQREAGVERRLVGLALRSRGIPRAEQEVRAGGAAVGVVTSGGHSPVLQRGIAMAYVAAGCAEPGRELEVVVRERALAAEVVDLPFVPARVKRRRSRPREERGGDGAGVR